MGLHDGHRERVKSKFIKFGIEAFEEHDALELLLFYSIPQRDTNELAHRLINEFGSLAGVMNASYESLVKFKGVGEHTAVLLKLVPMLGRKYIESLIDSRVPLKTARDISDFMLSKYFGETEEVAYLLCLDSGMRLIECRRLGNGTADNVNFDVKLIVERASVTGSQRLVLVHNHLSKFAVPSAEDISVTLRIAAELKKMGVVLVDHIILADDGYYSMAEAGTIQVVY